MMAFPYNKRLDRSMDNITYYIVLCNNFKDAGELFEKFCCLAHYFEKMDPDFSYIVYHCSNSILTSNGIMYIFIDHIMKDIYEKTSKQQDIIFEWYDDFLESYNKIYEPEMNLFDLLAEELT